MMNIKTVLFDLDGVLIDAKMIHFEALNKALEQVSPDHVIPYDQHISRFDGKKTMDKLDILQLEQGFDPSHRLTVFELKQDYTAEMISKLKPIPEIVDLFQALRSDGIKIGVCTNSIARTTFNALRSSGIVHMCDVIVTNEDVTHSKPYPEVFWKAMVDLHSFPSETLIVEDSPIGLRAAAASGAKYIRVGSPKQVTRSMIYNAMKDNAMKNSPVWQTNNNKLNILIPMAGAGSRFAEAGYTFPKPLISVHHKSMIETVVDNLGITGKFIFIVQRAHYNKYKLDLHLRRIVPSDCEVEIVCVDGLTQGAACTALLAQELIDNDTPLLIANSDQFVQWNYLDFMYQYFDNDTIDGAIVTMSSTHPKWSFVETDENRNITRTAEKEPISDQATVGIYYWRKGSDFVRSANQMIQQNAKVNGEYYICPTYNWLIAEGKIFKAFRCEKMWGLGTPEDLGHFLSNYKGEF